MKHIHLLILFSIFNFIAWNYFGLALILSIAILFYYIENLFVSSWSKRIIYTFTITFTFNFSSTFWLLKASWWEALLAFTGNSIVMSLPILLLFLINSKKYILYFFTFIWIGFEILHTIWDLSWPWLTFGNAMGNLHILVQWYSITGVYIGSLWLIFLGYSVYKIYSRKEYSSKKKWMPFLLFLMLPIVFSLLLYSNKLAENNDVIKTITYIPNDTLRSNYNKVKSLFFKIKDIESSDLIISPEVFLSKTNIENLKHKKEGVFLKKIQANIPARKILFGVELLNNKNQLFNTVMFLDKKQMYFRTKKKYVPLREYTPVLLRSILGDSFYTKNSIDNHDEILKKTKVFPMLCYESIFPYFAAKKSKDTNAIVLIASEEFMNDSFFGKKQYLNIVKLRAIENKKYILKCSTTKGVSCLINEKGDIIQKRY
jgi:apolipoprotein N-acyltransferase